MQTRTITVQRASVTSSKTFAEVIASLEAAVGRPDMSAFNKDIANAPSDDALQEIVHRATGPAELMIFMRLDLGHVIRKGGVERKSVRYLIGNPLTMRKMAAPVPDAGSYAPVTVLVDQRPGGVTLSYDRMASFLSAYENPEALQVARELDAKVEAILVSAASAAS